MDGGGVDEGFARVDLLLGRILTDTNSLGYQEDEFLLETFLRTKSTVRDRDEENGEKKEKFFRGRERISRELS